MSPPHRRIRLLIVDDSRFIRMALRAIADTDPDIEVVGEARNGADAIALARVLRPDIITMDLEMPEVDGLDAIQGIVEERPIPIIVLSGHTKAGVWTTFQALGRGAVDFMEKPPVLENMNTSSIESELLAKIHHWARRPRSLSHRATARFWAPAQPNPLGEPVLAPPTPAIAAPVPVGSIPLRPGACDLVVVAVSTGGPNTLPLLLKSMVEPLACPMVIAQHMPRLFTAGLAEHLSRASRLEVLEGEDNLPLLPGRVVVIAGGCDGQIIRDPSGGLRLRQRRAGEGGIHPSADILFESAADTARRPVAVVLTGIGSDGTAGAQAFARKGYPVFAQNPETAVVWGMPASVIEAGHATATLTVEEIGTQLARLSRAGGTFPATPHQ